MSDYLSLSPIKRQCKEHHPQSGPTANRLYSPISILNDDILLNTFYLFRLHSAPVREREDSEDTVDYPNWLGLRWWYKLAQVSRRWRRIILASPSLLDLHLLCTNIIMKRVPVAEMLAHSPPLPLAIIYKSHFSTAPEVEEDAILAISHHDRVRTIDLWMPAANLHRLIPSVGGEYPMLEYLSINSYSKADVISFTLPQTFRAPSLRHIYLQRAALPLAIRSPILTSNGGIVSLWLIDIPASAYFPPNHILTQLSLMPQLERLAIKHDFALPSRNVMDTTVMTHVPLPNLRFFSFQGVSTYLEGLLSRITTPVLLMFQVTFFNQLTFTVPRLLGFIQLSKVVIPADLSLCFYDDCFRVKATSASLLLTKTFDLRVKCRHLDWQVTSAAQLLHPLSPILSAVKNLRLTLLKHSQSSEWHNDCDRTQWRKLLEPFSNVKALRVAGKYLKGLSFSLRSEDGEPSMELLPNLEELTYPSGIPGVRDALTLFANERQAAGHPVHLQRRPYICDKCGAGYFHVQGLNRHFREDHLRPGTCPDCSWFTWPTTRPYLLKAHRKEYHMPAQSLTAESRVSGGPDNSSSSSLPSNLTEYSPKS